MHFHQQQPFPKMPLPWYARAFHRLKAKFSMNPKINRMRSSSRAISPRFLTSKPLPPLPSERVIIPPTTYVGASIRRDLLSANARNRSQNQNQPTTRSEETEQVSDSEQRRPLQETRPHQANRPSLKLIIPSSPMREAYNFLMIDTPPRPYEPSDRVLESRSPLVKDSMCAVTADIDPDMTREIIQGLGSMLAHIPFAVVGPAALVYYGRQRKIAHVSIVCPAPCMRAIFSWAQTKGIHRFRDNWRDSIAYRTSNGFLCRVRVRPLAEAAFAAVRVSAAPNPGDQAKVMILPNVVNEYARLYVKGSHLWSKEDRRLVAGDILWMLRRIVAIIKPGRARNEHEFTPPEVTWILTKTFWCEFTAQFPEAVELFCGAGVFRCLNRRAGLDAGGYPEKTRPTPPLPESLFDAELHARVHHWMTEIERFEEMEDIEAMEAPRPQPRPPVVTPSQRVSWSEPLVSDVNGQPPSFRFPAKISYVSRLRSVIN